MNKRSFMPAYALLMQLSGDLPERVVNKSLEVYSRLISKRVTRGRSRELLVKACINITCKQLNYPFSYSCVIKQEKFINQILGLQFKRVESQMFASKLGFELGLSEAVVTKAIHLVKEEYGLGPAAAAIHNVGGVSFRKLARKTGLSKNYIWRLSKTLKLSYLVNNHY